jgi:type I restriction enzyme, S subunit
MNEIAFQELLLDARTCESISGLRKLILAAALRGDFDDQKERKRQLTLALNSIQALPASNKTNRTRLRKDSSKVNPAEDLLSVGNEFVVELGTIATIEKGKTGIKDAIPGEYPLVVTAEGRLTADHFDFEGPAVVIPLVSSTGHGDASLKRIHYQEGRYAVGSILCAVQSRFPELVHPRYLYEYLSTFKEELLVSRMSGTANVSLTAGKIAEVPVPLMTYEAQEKLDRLMSLCDALEASGQLEAQQHAQLVNTLLGTLTQSETPEALADNWQRIATHFDVLLDRPEAVDALEQTILQLAVRGLLVPQDPTDEPASVLLQKIRTEKDHLIAQGKIKRDKPLPPITDEEKPFELPMRWQWVRFDELTHPLKPIAYGVLVPGPDVETGIPFVRIADLSLDSPASKPEKSISPEVDAQFQRTRLEGGEILMGVVGSIGKLGVAPKTWAGANIARAICRIVPADSGLNEFVLFLLQTRFMQESFAGDTRTLAQPTLNVGLIRAALTPLPPPAEQSRIVARINELRSLCVDLRARLESVQLAQNQLSKTLVVSQSHT